VGDGVAVKVGDGVKVSVGVGVYTGAPAPMRVGATVTRKVCESGVSQAASKNTSKPEHNVQANKR
jgi:hypothetical protein